jgi:hypothetical protein
MRFARLLQSLAAAIVLACAAAPASAMTFTVTTAPAACKPEGCIIATGDIDGDSGKDLARFVKANKVQRGAVVVMQSDGGNLLGGLALGTAIRQAGFATTVAKYDDQTGHFTAGGACASACAYAFLGGLQRSVGEGSRLGVHQVCGPPGKPWELSAQDSQWLMAMVAVYLNQMGVSMDVMILALRTSPTDMHWLSPVELAQYSVTNRANA